MRKLKLIILVTFALIVASCKHKQAKEQAPALKVEVIEATTDSLYSRINIATQVMGFQNATVQPRINGFLVGVHYQGGMPVRKGDLLFTIDPAEYSTSLYAARAAMESARAEEILAQRNYERAEPLAAIDAISKSDLDQYRASYKSALAATKSAKENLRKAQLEIGYTKIYAPIGGIAAKTTASTGDYIGPGTLQSELTTISQMDYVTVELPIPTATYLRYAERTPRGSYDNSTLLSQIVMTLPDSSTYAYAGEYYYTLKDTPSASSTVVIVAKFHNPEFLLKEGMFARIRANIGKRKGCITLPKSAVGQLQGINSVWVIDADSTAQWRKVELGTNYGSSWEITKGVEVGESVVVGGAIKLHNGAKVDATKVKQ
ncbi:MAG: efflux RND transporter periplasmic adaptor subunit [Rikenellaceae bacterium]